MAKLRFVTGKVTGRMGEFVGSMWKGINYIRTYSKPSNPNTSGQKGVREVFKKLSDFANVLFSLGIFDLFPSQVKMTERNAVFKANGKMLHDKVFRPLELSVCRANFSVSFQNPLFQKNGAGFTYSLNFNCPDTVDFTDCTAHLVFYDFVKGEKIYYYKTSVGSNKSNSFSTTIYNNQKWDVPDGNLPANCAMYCFVTAFGDDGKYLISSTLCAETPV